MAQSNRSLNQAALIPAEDALTVTKADVAALSPPSIMQAITLAVDKQSPIEVLERLWTMQKEFEDRQSTRDYNSAMSRVQDKVKAVVAELENTQTNSRYPSYKSLDDAVRPFYTAEGFSIQFDTGIAPVPDSVLVLAYINHSGGKEVVRQILEPMPLLGPKGAPVMNRTHGTNAAITYGQSKLLRMIFNIPVMGAKEDVDGNAEGGTMENLADWMDAIAGCNSLEQLKTEYLKALNVADEAKDTQAAGRLTFAQTKRARELRAQK